MIKSNFPAWLILLSLLALGTTQCRPSTLIPPPVSSPVILPTTTQKPVSNPVILPTATHKPIVIPTRTETPRAGNCPEVSRGLAYLKASYNPATGLLREAPNAAPHTYWISNDNALAAFTFDRLNQPEMSAALRNAIQRYGQPANGLLEVLWGTTVEFPPYVAHTEQLAQIGEDKILQELHTSGARFEDWAQYADLAFWGALNAYRKGHQAEAQRIYVTTMALFDGAGFRDKPFAGTYETYKLALALYVGAAIQAQIPNADALRSTLKAMQNANGGFFTHYRDRSHPAGDTNTETTSLALLALLSDCH